MRRRGIIALVLIAALVACRSMVTNITLDYKPTVKTNAAGRQAMKICLVTAQDERKNPFFLGRVHSGLYNLQAQDIATDTDVPTLITQAFEIELKNAQYEVKRVDEIPEKADVPVLCVVLRKSETGTPFMNVGGKYWAEIELSIRVSNIAGAPLVEKIYKEKRTGGVFGGAKKILPELFSDCIQTIIKDFLGDLKSALGKE
jgi:hypothetical protein